jgi:hypothetical protein
MTETVSLDDWLSSRTPVAPPALAARAREMAAQHGHRTLPPSDTLLAAAERAMRALMRDGCMARESALDLLAVDALVTYAFEAAADDPLTLERRAAEALQRIAALAQPFDT